MSGSAPVVAMCYLNRVEVEPDHGAPEDPFVRTPIWYPRCETYSVVGAERIRELGMVRKNGAKAYA
jgi:hypothetical protein